MNRKRISIVIPYYKSGESYSLWGQIREDSNPELDKKWEFAGGKVQANETATEAAIREFREEVGVLIKEKDLIYLGLSNYDYSDRSLIFYLYAIEIPIGHLPTQGWMQWNLSLESNLTRKIPAANLDFLLKLRQYLLS